jgi:methanogenic corrinoid protein MtbC1
LPGERYSLGSLICSVVTAVTSSKVTYMGIDTPIEETINMSKKYNPKLIALSVSHVLNKNFSEDCLFKLRSEINKSTLIVVGGNGSPCNISGVLYIKNFKKYYELLTKLNNQDN